MYDRKRSPDRFLFREGQVIREKLPKAFIEFEVSKERLGKYNCLCNSSLLPVVDSKTRAILDEIADGEVQYFDVDIECTDGVLTDYKIVNIVYSVQHGADLSRSRYETFEDGEISYFKYLVLKNNCLGHHAIARLEESKAHILLNQNLYDALKRHKIKGVELVTAEQWNERI